MNLQRLKQCRQDQRYSQRKIAEALGISAQQYFRIEKGLSGTTLVTAEKIAALLEVDLTYLLGHDAPTTDADPELEQLARRAAQLPEDKRDLIKKMLAAMLALGAALVVSSPAWATSRLSYSPNAPWAKRKKFRRGSRLLTASANYDNSERLH